MSEQLILKLEKRIEKLEKQRDRARSDMIEMGRMHDAYNKRMEDMEHKIRAYEALFQKLGSILETALIEGGMNDSE